MKIQKNFLVLGLLAMGMCLMLPASAKLIPYKIFVIWRSRSSTEASLVIGIKLARNERGEDVFAGIYAILPQQWKPIFKKHIPKNIIVEEVTFDRLPAAALIEILKYRWELYSLLLPYLLAKTSPKTIAESLPSYLLDSLTAEGRKKISPGDLKQLKELDGRG